MDRDDNLRSGGAEGTARWLTALVVSSVLYQVVERLALAEALSLDRSGSPEGLVVFVAAVAIAKTLLMLMPVLGLSEFLEWRGRRRLAWIAFSLGTIATCWLISIDVQSNRVFGLHVVELIRRLGEGGDAWTPSLPATISAVVYWLGVMTFTVVASAVLSRRPGRWLMRRGAWPRMATVPFLVALLLTGGVILLTDRLVPPFVSERLFATLPFDPRPNLVVEWGSGSTGELGHLDHALREIYRERHATLFEARPVDEMAVAPSRPDAPDVLLVVVESLRPDALEFGDTPRLSEWAKLGLLARGHHAGSCCSETGLFSLLYGRSSIAYGETLDAGVLPQAGVSFAGSGYRTVYFSGQPPGWQRQNEFLNAVSFDRFSYASHGSWPEWDSTALDGLLNETRKSDAPVFGVAYLMSCHFEYRYPLGHEIHLPVDADAAWMITDRDGLGPEARHRLMNRYRNCLSYLDEALDKLLRAVDLDRTIVVITGDHGESIGEGGRFGHFQTFSDVVARTPMIILGPGFEPAVSDELTLHADVLPTLLHAIAGESIPIRYSHGRSLLSDIPPRHGVLLTYPSSRTDAMSALLLSPAGRLAMTLSRAEPVLQINGFESDDGRLHFQRVEVSETDAATAVFARVFNRLTAQ